MCIVASCQIIISPLISEFISFSSGSVNGKYGQYIEHQYSWLLYKVLKAEQQLVTLKEYLNNLIISKIILEGLDLLTFEGTYNQGY